MIVQSIDYALYIFRGIIKGNKFTGEGETDVGKKEGNQDETVDI